MITAGIDAGLQTTKVAIVEQGRLLSFLVVPAGKRSSAAVAQEALEQAASEAGLSVSDVTRVTATGAGRAEIPLAKEQLPDFVCLARGINYLLPSTQMVLDIGALRSLVVRCQGGLPLSVAYSDKCASGTGRFLEMAADILDVALEKSGQLSLHSTQPVEVTSSCAVFAESELVSLIHARNKPQDILRGVYRGLALRLYSLLISAGFKKETTVLAMTGGVAKNIGVVKAIEEQIGRSVLLPPQPEIVAALGAALDSPQRQQCSSPA